MSLRHIVGRRAALVMVTGVAVLMLGPGCVSSPLEDLAQRTCDRLESDGPTLAPGIFDLAVDVAVGVGVIASKVGSAVAWASTVASTSGDGSDAFPHPATARKGTTIAANDAENLGLARIMGSAIVTFEPSGGPRRYARPAERAGP